MAFVLSQGPAVAWILDQQPVAYWRLGEAYGQCCANLVQHDPRFPTLEQRLGRMVADHDDTDDGGNRGQWSQIAASYNGKEAVAFVDGQPVVRELAAGSVVYTGVENVFEVGSADGGNLDGEIAALKVFDHPLSEAEVAADWEAGSITCFARGAWRARAAFGCWSMAKA